MHLSKIWILSVALLIAIAACQPLPDRTVSPTIDQTSVSSSSSSTISSASPRATVSTALPLATPSVVPTVVVAEEEDCMAACHVPDANELFAAGAKPQPATHVKLTTCLNCHATLKTPALPATHTGRMDPACAECHVPNKQ